MIVNVLIYRHIFSTCEMEWEENDFNISNNKESLSLLDENFSDSKEIT